MKSESTPSSVRASARNLRIGLTYDLRSHYLALGHSEEQTAEFDSPTTVEAITTALSELGHIPVQIGNVRELTRRLVAGERWELVFNIAEGLYGLGREALIPALLDAYRVDYAFSDPCVLAVCLHKGFTKSILRDAGLPTPDFALVREAADLDTLHLHYPLFAKPVAEGTGKGISAASRIENPTELRQRCIDLLARYRQPVLVEEYLPGREFTVGIVGSSERAYDLGTLEVVIREGGGGGSVLLPQYGEVRGVGGVPLHSGPGCPGCRNRRPPGLAAFGLPGRRPGRHTPRRSRTSECTRIESPGGSAPDPFGSPDDRHRGRDELPGVDRSDRRLRSATFGSS